MPIWLIPMAYVAAGFLASAIVPRLEHAYLASYVNGIAVASALAFLSAIASGMIALTAIVFSIAYITVQFTAVSYSPRLAVLFARDRHLFHDLGMFMATFIYALGTMNWVDRNGTAGVPLLSGIIVLALLIASMLLFTRMVRSLVNLQITNMLGVIGDQGRAVIEQTFPRLEETQDDRPMPKEPHGAGWTTQTLRYAGRPRCVARFDVDLLLRQASAADALIEMGCAVGDTLVEGTLILSVHGASRSIAETSLLPAVRLAAERTFEQDPKYPIRLLVDIAIKALSPAVNDPTTAVQVLDQLEDLLHRLGRRTLDAGYRWDQAGVLRLVFPMPTWEDYLHLAFDEIRQYGAGSVQVIRRLRAALLAIAEAVADRDPERTRVVQRYLKQIDLGIERSPLDSEDRLVAAQEDRQGLGLARKRAAARPAPVENVADAAGGRSQSQETGSTRLPPA